MNMQATNFRLDRYEWVGYINACLRSGSSSGVEHDLAKVGVEGSNPFSRSSSLISLTLSQSLPKATRAATTLRLGPDGEVA